MSRNKDSACDGQVTMLLSHGAMAQDGANPRIYVTEKLIALLVP